MNSRSGFAYKNSNNHEKDDFLDGLSAADIHTILYDLFNLKSPLHISKRGIEVVFNDITILRITNNLIITGIDYGFVDVTCFNNLEKRLKGLFCNTLKSENIVTELNSDTSFYLYILNKAGLIRQAGINWVFTKKAKQVLIDKSLMLRSLVEGVGYGVNWKLFDNREANEVGHLAFGISMILLLKYGNQYRPFSFYSEKYLHFFELIKDIPDVPLIELSYDINDVYSNRTFNCFAKIFDFVKIDNSADEPLVKASDSFSKIFKFG